MNVPLGDTYYFKFSTRNTSGAPTTLSGTPVISVYEEANLTQITAGVTLTVDYDSVTGLNDVAIVATTGNGYEAGKYYSVVITTGTVGGVSVVGEVVGHFRIMTAETTAGVPDVSLTAAGVDLIWDEAAAGHLTAGTTGLSIVLGSAALNDTTVTGTPTSTTIDLTAGSTVDSFYNDQLIYILSGTGIGQVRTISGYTGATKTVTVDEPWVTTPVASDRVAIIVSHVHPKSQISAQVMSDLDNNGSTVIDAIAADTNELQTDWANGGRLDLILDARASQTTADAIETDTQDIQSRIPAALVSGRIDADIGAISTSTTAADNLEASALGIVPGSCEGTPTTTVIQTDLAETTDDHYIGRIVVFTSGAAAGEASDITDYTGATGTITITAITTAPSASDTFVIV